jgi:hypothetical protein
MWLWWDVQGMVAQPQCMICLCISTFPWQLPWWLQQMVGNAHPASAAVRSTCIGMVWGLVWCSTQRQIITA